MFVSNVSGFDDLRNMMENPHGAQVIAFPNVKSDFRLSAGATTAQPVRLSLTFGL